MKQKNKKRRGNSRKERDAKRQLEQSAARKVPATRPGEDWEGAPHTIGIPSVSKADFRKQVARVFADPRTGAAAVMTAFSVTTMDPPLDDVIAELTSQGDSIRQGDLGRMESLLIGQAHALQAMFVDCALRMQRAELLSSYQTYGQFALKAQNQCRATLATLAEIKSPIRATFIKNTATNQQINVGATAPEISDDTANRLLETKPHERLDIAAPSEAVKADSKLETVGALNRAKVRGG